MVDFSFTYEDFRAWYEEYSRKFLEPAKEVAIKALNEQLDEELPEVERIRVKVSGGRVKSLERVLRKLELPKYRDQIKSLEDVPAVLDDLVGIRVTCNNKSDVQRVMEIVRSLETYKGDTEPVLGQEGDSYRDYLGNPKESGYRAVHINLCTAVSYGTKRRVVTCELQVRTLLQDGWGELTHEDTYKPGSTPPALVETLSRRMADLLAAVDDIAQDLRDALDSIPSKSLELESDGSSEDGKEVSAGPDVMRQAAMQHLRDRVNGLQRPIDLASLAWELAREFGQEISQGWLGHGSFKSLLVSAVPGVRVSAEPPSYVLPKDFDASEVAAGAKAAGAKIEPGIPESALALKQVDRGFPLVSRDSLQAAYRQLAVASQSLDWEDQTLSKMGRINELVRRARGLNSEEHPVARSHLDYIEKSLLLSRKLAGPLTEEEIRDTYAEVTIKRLRGVLALDQPQEASVRNWLT
ncbi:GTP pyrophosphokinase family protein [Streptomyces sp. NPDC093249]|uniref:GTP pyrophosphokinase n=1 Tax=unclassified Streptomyces TaxID=2593676 RepID=UPI00380963C2